jgi:hypothetical protein
MTRSNPWRSSPRSCSSIQKRDDDALTWEAFVKQPIDVKDETETEAKPRPTRAKAA